MTMKDDVMGALRMFACPVTASEICDVLYGDVPDWERTNKVKYIYRALSNLNKWGHVNKLKSSHMIVKWEVVE